MRSQRNLIFSRSSGCPLAVVYVLFRCGAGLLFLFGAVERAVGAVLHFDHILPGKNGRAKGDRRQNGKHLEEDVWRCYDCAYCVTQKDMLEECVFWFCDECGRFMNVQPGFTDKTGAWKCISCGFVNDVSKENVID